MQKFYKIANIWAEIKKTIRKSPTQKDFDGIKVAEQKISCLNTFKNFTEV
jgi:hypothetical protein